MQKTPWTSDALSYDAGQYDEAIEQEKKALDLDPHLRNAYVRLAVAYELKGMYPEAIAELKTGSE
ncbi:MAG: tetratricopeptide repeat protein, partial [Nitrospirae bacterium]|nr:tetratricopeptide repeat protein [Nitrospirota bacterium]